MTLMQMDKGFIILHLTMEAISPITPYINIYMAALIINELAGGKNLNTLTLYVCVTVGANMLLSLLLSGMGHLKNYHESQFYKGRSMVLSEKNMAMDYEHMEDREVHLLLERIKHESQTGYNVFYLYTSTGYFLKAAINIALAAALTFGFFINPQVSVMLKSMIIIMTAVVAFVNYYTTKKYHKTNSEMFASFAPTNGFFNFYDEYCHDYNAGKDIRLYAMEGFVADEQARLYKSSNNISVFAAKMNAKYNIFNSILTDTLRIGVYISIMLACAAGNVHLGDIAKYVGCIVLAVGSFSSLISAAQSLVENNKYLERYFKFMDIPSKMYQGTLTTEKRADNEYEIVFHNVSFKYNSTNAYALKNLNLTINVGKHMAVVGMNGSGKTTMIKLLCRLYDPTEGEITLNGIDIKKYGYNEYLDLFSVVFQDFKLFSFSLGQNVSAGLDYDKTFAERCLAMAGFGERLNEMEKGLETPLYKDFEETGLEISGGEAQKIALARALYKNAPFIVLDEPTAALDPIAEFEVY
jgi:ATP-binding cassette subfamily B protein